MHHGFVRGLLVAGAVTASMAVPTTRQLASLSVQDAVTLYASGQFDVAVRRLDTRQLKVAAFTGALDAWIATGAPALESRRRMAAVTFALDAVWTTTRNGLQILALNHDPWKNAQPDDPARVGVTSSDALGRVASWAADELKHINAPDDVTRVLWLCTIGVAEDGHAWYRVQNDIVPPALERLPGEPRLRLAAVLARTNRDLGSLRLQTYAADLLRDERLSSSVTRRIPEAIRALDTLAAEPTLGGEVALRAGYLELRRRAWATALARFADARATAAEPTLQAAADYFTGWVLEQQGRTDDAIVAYRRAIVITPLMRRLATRLSALLFLRNEREDAYAILDPALNASPAPVDLLTAIERGDARFVPEWLASIRRSIR